MKKSKMVSLFLILSAIVSAGIDQWLDLKKDQEIEDLKERVEQLEKGES